MPPSTYNEQVQHLAVDTFWSLWTELGAGGWTRRHSGIAIDVEALIIATNHPRLSRRDPRLIDQAVEWCTANIRSISAIRLRNLLKEFKPPLAEAFADFSATVKSEARAPSWPGSGKSIQRPLDRSSIKHSHTSNPDLSRTALIQLRLRGGWGVTARAEIIRLLLAEPTSQADPNGRHLSISELASGAAYSRDNVEDAVVMMTQSGMLRERGTGGWRQYQIAQRDPMAKLAGPLPEIVPDWPSRFRIMLAIWDLAAESITDPVVQAAEIARFRREHKVEIARSGIVFQLRQPGPSGAEPIEDFNMQSLRVLEEWAGHAVHS